MITNLKGKQNLKKRFDRFPGGFHQIKTDYQNATTVPQLKAVLAKIFKVMLDL